MVENIPEAIKILPEKPALFASFADFERFKDTIIADEFSSDSSHSSGKPVCSIKHL
jgi:hypothetical protein